MNRYRRIIYTALFCLVLFLFVAALADNSVADETDGARSSETVEYAPVRLERVSCATGVVYRVHPDGMRVEVASMAVGKGADFRKWKVTDTKLKVGGQFLRPSSTEVIYGTRESVFRMPAAVVFAAIGTQYERYASSCSASGGVCPVTGQPVGGGQPKQSGFSRGIDKVGMAAGLGLLAAQARGEIAGQKCVFELTKEQAKDLKSAKVVIENTGDNKKETVEVPLSGVPAEDAARILRDMAAKQPGMEHKAGVPTGGTFVTVDEKNGK